MFLREIPLRGGCSISCSWSPPALANSKQMWRPSSEEKAAWRDEWMPPTWVPWHALTSLLCCFWGSSELSARLVGIQSTHVISKLEIKPTFYLKENVLNRYEKIIHIHQEGHVSYTTTRSLDQPPVPHGDMSTESLTKTLSVKSLLSVTAVKLVWF